MKVKRFKSINSSWFVVMIFVLGLVVSSTLSFAADDALGKEIQAKAKMMKLDNSKVVHGEKNGKKITFTGANLANVKSLNELEQGQVVGVLESQIAGSGTNLPPGRYNVFVKKINGVWKAYAESNGRIVAEAKQVTVNETAQNAQKDIQVTAYCEIEVCVWYIFFSICSMWSC